MTKHEPVKAPDGEELRIGVFVCQCGANIAAAVDTKAVADSPPPSPASPTPPTSPTPAPNPARSA